MFPEDNDRRMKGIEEEARQAMWEHARRMQGASPSEAKMYWINRVEPDIARLTRAMLREMKDDLGVRPLASALDISPSYVMKLTTDESEDPPAPSVAQLDRFAAQCPERFAFLRTVLDAAPFFVQHKRGLGAEREAMGRRSGRPLSFGGGRFEEWQVAFGGRRREIGGILREMMHEFGRLGANTMVRWHGEAVLGVVDPGDVLFVAPVGRRPQAGGLALVRNPQDLYFIYGWDEADGRWRPLDQTRHAPSASLSSFTTEGMEVEAVGEIVGVLKAHRL